MLRDGVANHLNTRVTLPTHQVVSNGIPLLKEIPELPSLVRMYVSDADIESTYPNGEIAMNLSKETTMGEMCRIKGVGPAKHRLLGVNMTGGPVNSMEILTDIAKLPTQLEMLQIYQEKKRQQA